MTQLLREKGLATKFQILVEIASAQPNIQQKDIANKLNITPQAVSEYLEEIIKDGLVVSSGRSKYSITKEGLDWVLQIFKDIQNYSVFVTKAVTNITISAAVADCDLSKGQEVGLEMKDGLLFATDPAGKAAKGVAVSDAIMGEDVGVSDIEGIVPLEQGEITILKVPSIRKGGSRSVNLTRLNKETSKAKLTGAIGIEALISLKRAGIIPHYFYGVKEALIEAAHSGLAFLVVCVDDDFPNLIQRLGDEHLDYKLLDLTKNKKS